jgi:hypothetical protein
VSRLSAVWRKLKRRVSVGFAAESIVKAIYRTLLLREPEGDDLRAHVAWLRHGGPVEAILRDCLTSPKFSINFPVFYRKYLDAARTCLVLDSSQYGEADLLIRQIINGAAKHRVLVDVGAGDSTIQIRMNFSDSAAGRDC